MLDIENIPLDDEETWDLICQGNTKGVFQIESRLGKAWCRRMKPRSVEELAALSSAIRPGVLKAVEDGKSMTQHYSDRKNGTEEFDTLYKPIDHIVADTFGVILYQEQMLKISQEMAGFTKAESEKLRKAAGKKLASLMAKVRIQFIEGSINQGHKKEDAERIFDILEKSSRYSFNKCISPSTLVEKEDGVLLKIEDCKIGDKIKTPNGFADIVEIYDQGGQEMFEITLLNGSKINCSVDHKFLCDDGKIRAFHKIFQNGHGIKIDPNNNPLINYIDFSIVEVIKYIGVCKAVDIEIDSEDHIFYGNGIATSNSHSISYSKISYQTAYLKAHYPLLFYLEWMKRSDDKPDPKQEMRELIMSARSDGINIHQPSIDHVSDQFHISDGSIYFGVTNVKNVGKRDYQKILDILPDDYSWGYLEILTNLLLRMNKRSASNLVKVGFCDGLGQTRSTILHHINCLSKAKGAGLSPKELDWLCENLDTEESLEFNLCKTSVLKRDGGGTHNQKRSNFVLEIINKIKNPGRSLQDTPDIYSDYEEELLGVPVTYNRLDSCGDAFAANTTCKEVADGKTGPVIIACELMSHREHTCKDERKMCFLTVEDETSELANVVIFPDAYESLKDIIYDRATLLLMGNVVDRDGNVSFIVEEASII